MKQTLAYQTHQIMDTTERHQSVINTKTTSAMASKLNGYSAFPIDLNRQSGLGSSTDIQFTLRTPCKK